MGQSGGITSLKNNRKQVRKRNYFDKNKVTHKDENKPDLKDPKTATPEQLQLIRMQQQEYKRQQLYKKIIVFMVAGTVTIIAAIVVIYILREIFDF
jgi:lipopolysaccharide export LptBFGC system permease protein LptF